jgi:hypothetical protein
LGKVEETINSKVRPIADQVRNAALHGSELGIEILDGTAWIIRSLSLALNNECGFPSEALRVTTIAAKYAVSYECQLKLSEDANTLQFMTLRGSAADLAKAGRFRESLEKLRLALPFAGSVEEEQTILTWIEQAKGRLTYEGVKEIDRAPAMETIYGIGTKLYGKRDFDPESRSYIATLYFTILYIPIIPIAAYRVIDAGANAYRFLGKVVLTQRQRTYRWVMLGAGALFLLVMIINGASTSKDTTAPPGTARSTSSVTSGGDSEKAQLGAWLDQEKTRLDSEKVELDSIGIAIDTKRSGLNHQIADLKLRIKRASDAGAESPSQEEIDVVEASRRRFNEQVNGLNAREKRYQADVERYNEQVPRYNAMQ